MFGKTDLLTKKYLWLERVKVVANEKQWSVSGRNFLGLWRIIPDGIRRLRFTLKKLPPRDFDILSQEKMIHDMFDRTMEVLKRKQIPYRFVGKRLVKTQEFYTNEYEDGLRILGESDDGKMQLRNT